MGYQKIATFLASICTRFISEMILDRTLVSQWKVNRNSYISNGAHSNDTEITLIIGSIAKGIQKLTDQR